MLVKPFSKTIVDGFELSTDGYDVVKVKIYIWVLFTYVDSWFSEHVFTSIGEIGINGFPPLLGLRAVVGIYIHLNHIGMLPYVSRYSFFLGDDVRCCAYFEDCVTTDLLRSLSLRYDILR